MNTDDISKPYTNDPEGTKEKFEKGWDRVFGKRDNEARVIDSDEIIMIKASRTEAEMIIIALEEWKPYSWKGKAFTIYMALKQKINKLINKGNEEV